jgi:predicted outer membrane protein
MNHPVRSLLAAAVAVWPSFALAQGTITDTEEHLLRGFFDRQATNVAYAKLALKQGSTPAVRQFAQSELDFYTKLGDQVAALDREFGLVSSPMKAGAPPPELAQGVTRGVFTLSPGVTQFGPNIQAVVAGTGGGAPPGGAAPGGPPPGGGAPGGGGGPSGPNPNAGTDDTALLASLSGRKFDQEYALRAVTLHQRMESFTIREINTPGANPDLVAFAKSALVLINAQSDVGLGIYSGENRRPRRAGAPGGAPPG